MGTKFRNTLYTAFQRFMAILISRAWVTCGHINDETFYNLVPRAQLFEGRLVLTQVPLSFV